MTKRFEKLPERLREMQAKLGEGEGVDLGEWLILQGLLGDAALKIEALEREVKR